MKIGLITDSVGHLPFESALDLAKEQGLSSVEVATGNWSEAPHADLPALVSSAEARAEFAEKISSRGLTLSALCANGNQLHPVEGPEHDKVVRNTIALASNLEVPTVVLMSGLPGARGDSTPNWITTSWPPETLKVLDYQWNEVAIPFWKDIQARAADADVKVCIEMHPHNLVYNPATMERLATEVDATHVGAEMDPSHLFWQGIDPVLATEHLGGLVYNAAAKDTRINAAAKVNGVLDDRFGRVTPDDPDALSLGGRYTLSRWPENSSWDFVAVGRGHDVDFWTDFLRALAKVDPDMAVNIEHEDQELDQLEGLRSAAETLKAAAARLG